MNDDRDGLIFDLREALKEAIGAVKLFHGPGYDIYERHAPEMQRWKRVLVKCEHVAPKEGGK